MSASSRSRRCLRHAGTPLGLLAAAAIATAAGVSPAAARPSGRIAFAGLQSATTCIPGPSGGGRTSSYHLSWKPATEPGRHARISYEVYQARTPGGEDFSTPTYSTAQGVTSFDTPQLPTEDTFYFVVRARDRKGHEDSNGVEREGQNLCV